MTHHTENTGVPNRDASFLSRNQTWRLIFVLLLTVLLAGMDWQTRPVGTPTLTVPRTEETASATAVPQKGGLRMGDSITIVAAPVSIRNAKSMLSALNTRNVHIVFVLSQTQAARNQSLIKRVENDGHRVVVSNRDPRQEGAADHLNADEIPDEEMLSTLFDGCTLLCPVENQEKWARLLQISDTIRIQGIRILVPPADMSLF